jgi:hypothetical protein
MIFTIWVPDLFITPQFNFKSVEKEEDKFDCVHLSERRGKRMPWILPPFFKQYGAKNIIFISGLVHCPGFEF